MASPRDDDIPDAIPALIERDYGPFAEAVNGVSYDGTHVWCATGTKLQAFSPESGRVQRALEIPNDAGTAFDGQHLYQIAAGKIHKLDPISGRIVASVSTPVESGSSGLTWAEGFLWVGDYPQRKIHQVDPKTGAVLRTLESNRFVTGVSWSDGELWHGTLENDASELRRVDPSDGRVLERLSLPAGIAVSGLASDGAGRFYCGGAKSGRVRAVRKPKA